MYPYYRPRRLRENEIIRDLIAETKPDYNKLIMPYFVIEGVDSTQAIESMPGIQRLPIDNLLKQLDYDVKLGVRAIILFGIPYEKDEKASGAYDENGIVQKACREIKKQFPELLIITDVCLCEYTSHGHCGMVKGKQIDNDSTLELLAKTAVSHAMAGADIIAPSDMMDGRVEAIRQELDDKGFMTIPILSYAAKYASAFYGPFRDAAGSAPQFGDRRSYQMDYRNAHEALKEVYLDIDEGADIVMVKPALSYLDIIYRVKQSMELPVCAYNVSGEYSMVKAAGTLGFGDEAKLVREIMTAIFRAGADMVISYHTCDILKNRWFD
ncbi:MAG TPA: porphobilinogen synthase [Spirochaetota bacterium]|nr:porphobilinogen synthase [Spirochaetota bacterium]HQL43973.1 porphobilinogen synthase [Spirochaetota bacterium]